MRMKILFVVPSICSGGAEKTFVTLSDNLHQMGYDVTILACKSFDEISRGTGVLNIPDYIKKYSLNTQHVRNCIFKIAKFIRQGEFDIVVSTISHMNIVVSFSKLMNFQNYKLFIRDCSIHKKPKTFMQRIVNLIMRFAYSKADGLISVTKTNKKNLDEIGVFNKNTEIIYNPVVASNVYKLASEPLPTEFSFLENEIYLVTVASLTQVKNQALMIRSFKKIVDKFDCKLVLVGDGPLRSELEELAKSLGLKDKVIFAGFQKNPLAFVSRAKIFVLTSFKEAGSRSLMEAISVGTTAACIDVVGSSAEILDDGRFGIVVKSFDEDVFANAIYNELTNPIFKKEDILSRSKAFSIKENTQKYLSFFEKSISNCK